MSIWRRRYGGLRLPNFPTNIKRYSPPFDDTRPGFLQVGMLGLQRRLMFVSNPVISFATPSPQYSNPKPSPTLAPSRYLKMPSNMPALPCAGVCPGASVQAVIRDIAVSPPTAMPPMPGLGTAPTGGNGQVGVGTIGGGTNGGTTSSGNPTGTNSGGTGITTGTKTGTQTGTKTGTGTGSGNGSGNGSGTGGFFCQCPIGTQPTPTGGKCNCIAEDS